MNYLLSVPMPMTYWGLLSTRLQAELNAQKARAVALATPVRATVETKNEDAARLALVQTSLRAAIARVDSLSLLELLVRQQTANCRFQIGVLHLSARIEMLEGLYKFYQEFTADRTSRAAADQAVALLRASFASASKPQGGEWAVIERGRLLAQEVHLPVFSAEDAVPFEKSALHLRNDLDSLKTELDSLLATTLLQLSVPDSLVEVLTELGIGIAPLEVVPEPVTGSGEPEAQPAEPVSA
jgi:hypothetical protein